MATSDSRLAIELPRRRARSIPLLGAALLALAPAARAQLPRTTRVSVDSSGGQANGASGSVSMSADGRFVIYYSNADNLIAGDANLYGDVFVHDRVTHVTECESVDPTGATGNGASSVFKVPTISADGRYALFESDATNLTGGNDPSGQLYLRDRSTATTEVVSIALGDGDGTSDYGTITTDGSLVAFQRFRQPCLGRTQPGRGHLSPGSCRGNDDARSRLSQGIPGESAQRIAQDHSRWTVRRLLSYASNLVSGDTNATTRRLVYDVSAGTIERASVDLSGAEGNSWSQVGAISADGRFGRSTAPRRIWSAATRTGCRRLRPRPHYRRDGAGQYRFRRGEADRSSIGASPRRTEAVHAFQSSATNLVSGDTNGCEDIFVHDRSTGTTTRVSVDSNGTEANVDSHRARISANGATVAFQSFASNLVSGDTNNYADIFVNDSDVAAWTNYGSGFPGTNGIPSFTSSGDPTLGTTITLDLANSSGLPAPGLLFAGVQRATLHTNRGGDLLLLPLLAIPITFSYSGDQFPWSIPADATLAGLTIDLQAVEADTGAANGVSFTAGLELAVGF
jgi:hypothetical protein